MSRQKYQRPEGYATGKREKLWKGEWREHHLDAEGRGAITDRSKTWNRAHFTKAEAQAKFDALLRDQQQGGPKRDGSMTLAAFWEDVFYPVHAGRWAVNSRRYVDGIWWHYIHRAGQQAVERDCQSRHRPAPGETHCGRVQPEPGCQCSQMESLRVRRGPRQRTHPEESASLSGNANL
jgi:hypothetical protein